MSELWTDKVHRLKNEEIERLRAQIESEHATATLFQSNQADEIDRLRAENAEMKHALSMIAHASPMWNAQPLARAILAKTASHPPASDQEPQKSD